MSLFGELDLFLDTAEPRIGFDRLALLVPALDFDLPASTNVFRDGVTDTLLLAPLPTTPAWNTTTSGNYARLAKADYSLVTPTAWVEDQYPVAGSYYLQAKGVNEVVTTLASWPANQGFLVSWFAYNANAETFAQFECGWGAYHGAVWLQVWSDGKAEVWSGLEKLGEGSLTGKAPVDKNLTRSDKKAIKEARALENDTVRVMLIPCRTRELLVLGNQGGGFNHVFEEIPEDAAGTSVITPAGTFWWRTINGQSRVQCAPLRYATSGIALSPVLSFQEPPRSGATADVRWIEDATDKAAALPNGITASLREADGTTVFVPNGTKRDCRIRLDLAGNGSASPLIYAAAATFPPVVVYTDGTQATALADFTRKSSPPELSVSESPADVRLTVEVSSPQAIENAGAAYLASMGNRPFTATLAGQSALFAGVTTPPNYEEAYSDAARPLTLEVRDWCERLGNYRFRDPLPFDGANLAEAFRILVTLAGFPAAFIDVEEIDFTIPVKPAASRGEFAWSPEVGDTALQWIQKLHEAFVGNYVWGFRPFVDGVQFFMRSPSSLNAAGVAAVLYQTTEDALYRGGWNPPRLGVFRSFTGKPVPIEANDIWVIGRDRSGAGLAAHYADALSQQPDLLPSARPVNWWGEPLRYGLTDDRFTTQGAADWAATVLAQRLTVPRFLAEWEGEFLLRADGSPVWRGDNVALDGKGVFRVISLSGRFAQEGSSVSDNYPRRAFRYVGERVSL